MTRKYCLDILDLPATASKDDLRNSYRELIKVWHPDRFEHDQKLRHKAQEKLKQINLTYSWLNEHWDDAPKSTPPPGESQTKKEEPSPPKASQKQGRPPRKPFLRTVIVVGSVVLLLALSAGIIAFVMRSRETELVRQDVSPSTSPSSVSNETPIQVKDTEDLEQQMSERKLSEFRRLIAEAEQAKTNGDLTSAQKLIDQAIAPDDASAAQTNKWKATVIIPTQKGTIVSNDVQASIPTATVQQSASMTPLQTAYANALSKITADAQQQKDDALAQYDRRLGTVMETLKQKGDLAGYIAVEQEQKRSQTDKTVLTNAPGVLIANAVASYQKQVVEVRTDAARKTASLVKRYIAALGNLIKDQMAQDKIDEAKAVGKAKKSMEVMLSELESGTTREESNAGGIPAKPSDQSKVSKSCTIEIDPNVDVVICDLKPGAHRLTSHWPSFKTVGADLNEMKFTQIPWTASTTYKVKVVEPGFLYAVSSNKNSIRVNGNASWAPIEDDKLTGDFIAYRVRAKVAAGQTFEMSGYEVQLIARCITIKKFDASTAKPLESPKEPSSGKASTSNRRELRGEL